MTGLFMPSPAPTRINQKNVPNYMFIAVQCANVSESQCSGTNILQFWSELCIWTTTSQTLCKTKICIYSCKRILTKLQNIELSNMQNQCSPIFALALWLTLLNMSKYGERTQHSQCEENPSWVKSWPWKDHIWKKSLHFWLCWAVFWRLTLIHHLLRAKSHNNKSWATQQLW